MDKRTDRNIFLEAIRVFGEESQIRMMMEEMAELQKELCKYLRGRQNRTQVAEEIADVQIMLDQMMQLFHCQEEVKKWRAFKLARLEALINKETVARED